MWRIIFTVVQVFSAFAIIGLVLLQRGKGAEAGAGFGAGASGTVFGARGASTALSRATAIFAAIFMINSLLLTYVGMKVSESQPQTILDQAGGQAKTPAGAAKTPAPNTATVPQPAPAPSSSPATAPAPAAPGGTAPPEGAPPK
ncbi:MAG: preprotein translocase subunit SecG [Proteobacteria bacterium]|nr:preprotein translocase subunit SecG [Pseudomonadota bacterium]